jgi:Lrp/AsnC family transcriptional regulator
MLDDEDRRILRHWQGDAGLSPGELADRVGLSPGKVARRIVRMQEAGIVEGVGMTVDWAALGYTVEVSLRITLDKTQGNAFDAFLVAARKVDEVIEIQTFLGRVDVRLSIIARDMAHYQAIYRGKILTLPHIADIEALMHVARIKSDEALPL